MSTFGDSTPDDAYDPSPPDAEQVARRLHRLRVDAEREDIDWDDLSRGERLVLIAIIANLIDWLRREGSVR